MLPGDRVAGQRYVILPSLNRVGATDST